VQEKLPLAVSKQQLGVLAVVALVALRLGVGWQFFREGSDKVHNGFSSAGFFAAAKGPLAPAYHNLLPDPDGLTLIGNEDSQVAIKRTETAWNEFKEAAISHYDFGDDGQMMAERSKLERWRNIAEDEKEKRDYAVKISQLNREIAAVRMQKDAANEIAAGAVERLKSYFDEHAEDIAKYRRQLERRERNRAPGVVEVASLRGQAERTEAELRKDRAALLGPLSAMWDDYEQAINALATQEQIEQHGELALARPSDNVLGTRTIDAVVPWLDLAIGVLLILGLFTRPAAVVGAVFLASIMFTQWPGSIGAQPIYYQFNLMLALLVLAATGAGRYCGLDSLCGMVCGRCCRARRTTTTTPSEA
jgi:uncharacterized membrane protein YphA (DoxX/SURF4 family)